jgi:hypothetical protein
MKRRMRSKRRVLPTMTQLFIDGQREDGVGGVSARKV